MKPGVYEQNFGLKLGSPHQLQRNLLFHLVRQFNVAVAPFRTGLHDDRGGTGIHRFDAQPDVALVHFALQRAHDIGGVVRNEFRDDRSIVLDDMHRRLINLIHAARITSLDLVLHQRHPGFFCVGHGGETTRGNDGQSGTRRKNFCLHIGYNPIEKAARVKHDCIFARLDKHGKKCEFGNVSANKLEQLRAALRAHGSCLVAYSGGVDSVFLARVAHEVLGSRALAVIADSPSLPRRELQEALEIAEKFRFPVRVVRTAEFENPDYLSNPVNRCFFCKHELFGQLAPIARAEKFAVIAYGENASDNGDFRPGAQAAAEFQVRAPLKEVGLTKSEIRELSAQLGLPTADKPQMACLSSRIPYGESVTPEKLRMIEAAENVLRDLGFHDVRVRHHELRRANNPSPTAKALPATLNPQPSTSHLARIELGLTEIPRFLEDGVTTKAAKALKKIGYAHVTLDLQGYRRGSLNEKLDSRITDHERQNVKREA